MILNISLLPVMCLLENWLASHKPLLFISQMVAGGPTDQVREELVQQVIQAQIDSRLPHLHHHPLLLPKSRGINLDHQTTEILIATHAALNISNPSLASDCWLCLALGASWPLVIPLLNDSTVLPSQDSCSYSRPFKVLPNSFNVSTCLFSPFKNNSFDVDLGLAMFTSCNKFINSSASGCLGKGRVYVCGIIWHILSSL